MDHVVESAVQHRGFSGPDFNPLESAQTGR